MPYGYGEREQRAWLIENLREYRQRRRDGIDMLRGLSSEINALYMELKVLRGPARQTCYDRIQGLKERRQRLQAGLDEITAEIDGMQGELEGLSYRPRGW
jgi:hypothetical protein